MTGSERIKVWPRYRGSFERVGIFVPGLAAKKKLPSKQAQLLLSLTEHDIPCFVGDERFDPDKHVNFRNLYQWRVRLRKQGKVGKG